MSHLKMNTGLLLVVRPGLPNDWSQSVILARLLKPRWPSSVTSMVHPCCLMSWNWLDVVSGLNSVYIQFFIWREGYDYGFDSRCDHPCYKQTRVAMGLFPLDESILPIFGLKVERFCRENRCSCQAVWSLKVSIMVKAMYLFLLSISWTLIGKRKKATNYNSFSFLSITLYVSINLEALTVYAKLQAKTMPKGETTTLSSTHLN